MYRRILLAADGSRESLVALREGALIAQSLKAQVFLLIVVLESVGFRVADTVHHAPRDLTHSQKLLATGLERLAKLGVAASGQVVLAGEPAPAIAERARLFGADLIVVGHRRQSLFERWWSGSSGAYLIDTVGCSVLVARNLISDAEFETHESGSGGARY